MGEMNRREALKTIGILAAGSALTLGGLKVHGDVKKEEKPLKFKTLNLEEAVESPEQLIVNFDAIFKVLEDAGRVYSEPTSPANKIAKFAPAEDSGFHYTLTRGEVPGAGGSQIFRRIYREQIDESQIIYITDLQLLGAKLISSSLSFNREIDEQIREEDVPWSSENIDLIRTYNTFAQNHNFHAFIKEELAQNPQASK